MTIKGNGEIDILTAREVSTFLKIPLSTLYGLAKQGKIKGVKVGKHWRYLRSDILEYFRGKRRHSTVPTSDGPNDRRDFPRINSEIPAEFQITLSRKPVVSHGMLFSLSEAGATYQDGPATSQMQVGDPVVIVFQIGGRKIQAHGRIVHLTSGVGIKFRVLSGEDREAIREYVG